jgi:hypothetical protein
MHNITTAILIFLVFCFSAQSHAQWSQDYENLIEVSNIKALDASASHLYVLSELEGMAVFRVYGDSLQWLYTSSGMQRRGNIIESDIRFAYLYGNSTRLTVLEPTSVLGVFSSTQLPVAPRGVARLADKLYVALGEEGLGELPLTSPDEFDSEATIVANGTIGRVAVLDVVSSLLSNQLFVLSDDRKIHSFQIGDNGLESISSLTVNEDLTNLFIQNEKLWGSTDNGDLYSVTTNGLGRKIGATNTPILKVAEFNNTIFVRTQNGQLWISENNGALRLWQGESQSGNFIAKSTDALWISIFDKVSPLQKNDDGSAPISTSGTNSGAFRLKSIDNKTLTFPQPLITAIELESGDHSDVTFTYKSPVANARIQKQGFYWQPSVNQVGITPFTIIGTNSKGEIDSTSFTVEVRTFNTPPRFSPIRGSTIAVNDPYQITFNAIDPENPSNGLIRYLGVDLPEGSTLNEQTGEFSWTPNERQIGDQSFRIVATDEQGTASSIEVTYKVINISRGE